VPNSKSRTHPSPPVVEALAVRTTGAGSGGIATFTLDGWGVVAKLQPYLRMAKKLRLSERGDLYFAHVIDRRGQLVDEALVAFLASDETATGYEQIELSCHGGLGAATAVEDVLADAGFRRAQPSELLARAHLNNRLPIVSVEAQLALPRAVTARQAEFLLGSDVFLHRWERLGFDAAMGMRTRDGAWRERTLVAAREALARAPSARALLCTHTVVLTGPVNAGKSTLANRLAGAERHIVSPEPGTTRDRVESRLALRGLDVALSDTAGMRATHDDLEAAGQRRAHAAAAEAALRVLVLDGSVSLTEEQLDAIGRLKTAGPLVIALNKGDLPADESTAGLGFLAGVEPLSISARDGTGLDALEDAIEAALLQNGKPAPGDPFTLRQIGLLDEIRTALESGFEGTLVVRSIIKLIATRGNDEQLRVALDAAR